MYKEILKEEQGISKSVSFLTLKIKNIKGVIKLNKHGRN